MKVIIMRKQTNNEILQFSGLNNI